MPTAGGKSNRIFHTGSDSELGKDLQLPLELLFEVRQLHLSVDCCTSTRQLTSRVWRCQLAMFFAVWMNLSVLEQCLQCGHGTYHSWLDSQLDLEDDPDNQN